MGRVAEWVARYPRTGLFLLAAVTLFVGSFARHTEFDASIRSFILRDDPDYQFYLEYKRRFGRDDMLAIAFEAEDVFAPESLRLIDDLSRDLEDVDNIHDVRSLTNVEYIRPTSDGFETAKLIDEIPATPDAYLAEQKKTALADPMIVGDLTSTDARKTSILVTLAACPPGYDYQQEILRIEEIVREASQRAGLPIHLMGERYLDVRFLRYIHRDMQVFLPCTVLLLMVMLFAIFRSVRETLIGLAPVLGCLMWIGGLVPLAGFRMNPVNAGLPSLVLCIAVTDVVHLLHRHRKLRATVVDPAQAAVLTVREMALPCFLTSFTTGIGFGSLAFNEMTPIQSFGILAALGVSICYPVCMFGTAGLLRLFPGPMREPVPERPDRAAGLLGGLSNFLVRRRRLVAAALTLFLLASVAAAFRLDVQADRVRYLREESDLAQSVAFIEQNLAGTQQLDISIEGGKPGAIKEPEVLRKIEALTAFLRAQPEVDKVLSIEDFVKDMNQAFYEDDPAYYVLPETREAVAQFLLIYSMAGTRNELDHYVDYPYSRTRISVRTSEHNSAKIDALIARIDAYLAEHFHAPLEARMASVAVANNNVFHYLVKGLMSGLGLALLIVGAVLCLTFRSLVVGLVSLIPNAVPIAITLGLMGACGIWLEIATCMTFSIALGIAVDDTIHFMTRFREELRARGGYPQALRATMEHTGMALVHTTVLIAGGFLILSFASLKMNMLFGLLSAFIMVAALGADLIVTPLCLLLFRPFRAPKVKVKSKAKQPAARKVLKKKLLPLERRAPKPLTLDEREALHGPKPRLARRTRATRVSRAPGIRPAGPG